MRILFKTIAVFIVYNLIFLHVDRKIGKIGKIMTGPPSHGDYVLCWKNNEQVVISGGLCNCKTKKESHTSLINKLINYKSLSVCDSYRDQYYFVGVIDGYMISTSNETTITELMELL